VTSDLQVTSQHCSVAIRMATPESLETSPPADQPVPEAPAADALAEAAERIGDRWSLLVVAALLSGPRRFGDLLTDLDGIAPNILSNRLARLEAEGLVVGEPYTRRPVRHAYRLTAAGADLAGALRMLAQWAASHRAGRHGGGEPGLPTHGACGTALEARWFCPTCGEVVDDVASADVSWI
jgi:DNA-binding HxlR family transcriptional regulator